MVFKTLASIYCKRLVSLKDVQHERSGLSMGKFIACEVKPNIPRYMCKYLNLFII